MNCLLLSRKRSRAEKTSLTGALILIAVIVSSSFLSTGLVGTVQAASPPATAWTHNYGSYSTDETAYSVVQTSDGGYMLAGTVYSYPNPPTGYHALLVKTDSSGNMKWNKTYAGNGQAFVRCVVQTSDGGYAFVGYTLLSNSGFYAVWLVKTDSIGSLLWSRTYNLTAGNAYGYSLIQTSDGGYAFVGSASTIGGNYALFLRTDAAGKIVWLGQMEAGGYFYSVVQTNDGGFALVGSRFFRFNVNGGTVWNASLADPEALDAHSIIQTSDGGFAYAGDKRSLNVGNDIYLVKTDIYGKPTFNKTYGGSNDDSCTSLVQTLDGGYALAGRTKSYGAGSYDFYLVKTDNTGTMEWQKTYGGAYDDGAYSLIQTADHGLALAGYTYSYTNGGSDMWLVKLSALASEYSATISSLDYIFGSQIFVPITMDGVATGYYTPHTFTGLTGTHTFTVPSTNMAGHPFSDWSTGWTDRTITVGLAGTYTAWYRGGYSVTIWSWCALDAWLALPITKDGVATGYSTPHIFSDLNGPHTFTVPSTDANGHPFYEWSTGSTSRTLTTTSAGVYTARYEPVPTVNSFSVSPNPFSPNGDGTKDNTTIKATFSRTVKWNLQIRNSLGTTLRTWTGTGTSLSILWDGKNSTGFKVPDGTYTVRLSGKDLQGVAFITKSATVTVDTKRPTVTGVSVYPTSFKPSSGQATRINYTLSESCYVTLKVYNSTGALKRTLLNGVLQSSGLHSVVWNGKDSSSLIVPKGTYTIKIYVVDKAGNKAASYPIIKTVTVL